MESMFLPHVATGTFLTICIVLYYRFGPTNDDENGGIKRYDK